MTEDNSEYPFKMQMEVRDYECDMQGIVNNAVYLNYFEHARHRYMHYIGLDFARCIDEGVILVVRRNETDYIRPLKSGDVFSIYTRAEPVSRLRCYFHQRIFRPSDNTVTTEARILVTGINPNGRPYLPREILKKITGSPQKNH